MSTLSIRNISDRIHLALKARAASNCSSAWAESRAILENSVSSSVKVCLDAPLVSIGKEAALEKGDLSVFKARDLDPVKFAPFELFSSIRM